MLQTVLELSKLPRLAPQHPGPDVLPEAEPGLPEVGQHVLAWDFAVGLVVLSEWPYLLPQPELLTPVPSLIAPFDVPLPVASLTSGSQVPGLGPSDQIPLAAVQLLPE